MLTKTRKAVKFDAVWSGHQTCREEKLWYEATIELRSGWRKNKWY